jgi:tRNA 2-selenouridine synthase
VESESKKVGGLHIPDALMERIREGDCIEIVADRAVRVDCLMEDYEHFLDDGETLGNLLKLLTQRFGKEQISHWQKLAQDGQFPQLVEELLIKHYDPAYTDSIVRNFPKYRNAMKLHLSSAKRSSYQELANQLLSAYELNA